MGGYLKNLPKSEFGERVHAIDVAKTAAAGNKKVAGRFSASPSEHVYAPEESRRSEIFAPVQGKWKSRPANKLLRSARRLRHPFPQNRPVRSA